MGGELESVTSSAGCFVQDGGVCVISDHTVTQYIESRIHGQPWTEICSIRESINTLRETAADDAKRPYTLFYIIVR